MTKKPAIHTVPNPQGGWDNKREGQQKPISHHTTKNEATQTGRQDAVQSKTEHVIHNKDGKISEKNSYGNDPCPPKDKR